MKRRSQSNPPENPRIAVINQLLSMAQLFRTRAKITDEADEAMDWEKKLRARAEELDAAA